jgi:hypothetical protein
MTDRAQQLAQEAKRLRAELCTLYYKQGNQFSRPRMQEAVDLIRGHDAAIDALAALSQGASEVRAVAPPAVSVVPTDAVIAAAWRAWPKTAITSAASAIAFVRSVLAASPPEAQPE